MTLTWDPPGKGDWRGLHDHFPRALTAEYQLLLKQGMEAGEGEWFESYGLPMKTITPVFIHGRVFIGAVPLIGPQSNRLPPKPLLWLAIRFVPAFRRRAKAAERTVATRPWLAETEAWYRDERPAWIERNTRLEAIDPTTLDDDTLVDHLVKVRANAYDGYRTHFRLHGPDLIPTSMLLGRAVSWGLDPVAVTGMLAGASPTSRGTEIAPDWQLVTGYDLDERCAVELPRRELSTRVPRTVEPPSIDVPAEHRAEWDELLADARATYGVRDDNGLITAAWSGGLVRRAMLAAGARLGIGELAVELTVDELVASLLGAPVPDAAARQAERQRLSAEPAPQSLGPPTDLPLDALPPAMRRIADALLAQRDLGITVVREGEGEALHGVGIGSETVKGRAVVALEPADAFARFEPGDIVVTRGTCPAWNSLLALAGGIVVEEGGPLSHAAVIARELGLPALIGAPGVMTIPDGADIELDPAAGVVRVLS